MIKLYAFSSSLLTFSQNSASSPKFAFLLPLSIDVPIILKTLESIRVPSSPQCTFWRWKIISTARPPTSIIFSDGTVKLDVVPRHYFLAISDELPDIAFASLPNLKETCALNQIAPFFHPNEYSILKAINHEFNLSLKSLRNASKLLEHQRYIRLNHLIDSKFTDEKLYQIFEIAFRSNLAPWELRKNCIFDKLT